MGAFSDFFTNTLPNFFDSGWNPTPTVIEKSVLNLAYDSTSVTSSMCMAYAMNQVAINVNTNEDIDITNLVVNQFTDAVESCTTSQGISGRGNLTAAAFQKMAEQMITTSNAEAAGTGGGNSTDTTNNIQKMSSSIGTSQLQNCLAFAANSVVENVYDKNRTVEISGVINQNANAIIANCVNVSSVPGSGVTAAQLAAQIAKTASVNTNSALGANINNEVHMIWTTVAIVAACILFIIVMIRVIVFYNKGK